MLSAGDIDEAVAGLLTNGLVASGVNGAKVPAGFTRISAVAPACKPTTWKPATSASADKGINKPQPKRSIVDIGTSTAGGSYPP